MTAKERQLALRLIGELKRNPEYGKQLQIEVTVPTKKIKKAERSGSMT